MLITTLLQYLVTLAVLVTLVATLMYVTKAIKAKDDKDEKNACVKKASLFFLAYLAFNAVRLYIESGPK